MPRKCYVGNGVYLEGTNDQQHINDALKVKDYLYVWEIVKPIGVKIVPDMNERMAVFNKAIHDFDHKSNNNFIGFYTTRLTQSKVYDSVFYRTKNVLYQVIRNSIIPPGPDEAISNVVKDSMSWR